MLRLNCNITSDFRDSSPCNLERVVEQLHIASKTDGWKSFGWRAESVDKAMSWARTPQGHEFWRRVSSGRIVHALGELSSRELAK